MTIGNICFYFRNRLIQTSQTGGQRYSDTSPFSIPCIKLKPTLKFFLHFQDLDTLEGARPRKMDRLRRSFRASIKRKKDLTTQSLDPTLSNVDGGVVKCVAESTKLWQADEVAVRSGPNIIKRVFCGWQNKLDRSSLATLSSLGLVL